jgi:hypothetical protein
MSWSMSQSSAFLRIVSGCDRRRVKKPADKTNTTEPRRAAKSPAYRLGLFADAALARGDAQEAEEMIQFAYWAADAGDMAAT